MTKVLPSPETPADAFLIAQALRTADTEDDLLLRFGTAAVGDTQDNALAWIVQHSAEAITVETSGTFGIFDPDRRIDETVPPNTSDTLAEPLLTDQEPKPFDRLQTTVILSAIRRAVRDTQIGHGCLDYLSRHSPLRTERALCKLALLSFISIR